MFDLQNTHSTVNCRLRPLGGPWGFFSRMRILAGREILEEIDMYNRVREMFSIFSASDSRQNDYAEGFGKFWDNKADNESVGPSYLKGIPESASQTVLFKPLRIMPLTIELSLVDDMKDPIVSKLDIATNPVF